jgi:alpha-1,6-mannosyltransferase
MPAKAENSFRLLALLAALGAGLAVIFIIAGRQPNLAGHVPEFIALMLFAGALYLAGVYIVCNYRAGGAGLFVILGVAVLVRVALLPARPSLSDDVYRYQWDGRIVRAGINPYTVYPAMPPLKRFQNPDHPIATGQFTPTVYPPLSEWAFASVRTIPSYKLLFVFFDLATLGAVLLLLKATGRSLALSLIYAWNPAVIVSFALGGHHDSLAVFTLMLALYFTISGRGAISMLFLGLSFVSKLFSGFMLPVFAKRTKVAYVSVFFGIILLAYLPFASGGRNLFRGLSDFARGWEGNDSLLRLMRLVGNSKAQAELVAGVLLTGLIIYALRRRMEPVAATLLILTGLLFLSPNAFPWYFTWLVPLLCFVPNPPLLLLTVTCVLGYSPVVSYAAGGSFANQPVMLWLEYAPVFAWLAWLTLHGPRESKDRPRIAGASDGSF